MHRSNATIKKIVQSRYASYKRAICEKLNSPLIIRNSEHEIVRPKHIKIKISAAGINFADILQCQGKYQEKKDPPFCPGMECAGEVVEIGSETDKIQIGDRVICITDDAFSEYVTLPASNAFLIPRNAPKDLDLAEGASLLVSYGTAHLALLKAQLQPGETVLVSAAAGGVGLATVDLAANVFKSNVIGATSTAEKLDIVFQKGAMTPGITYFGMDGKAFRESLKNVLNDSSIKQRTKNSSGVDVFVDMVGNDLLEAGVRSLNWGGRAVVIGFAGGNIPKLPVNVLLVKNVSISGLYWGAHLKNDPRLFFKSSYDLIDLWARGVIRPHVSHKFPLDAVNDAFKTVYDRTSTGKVVVIPSP